MCDAQHIGSIDGDTPARAYQDVSPSVARLVWRRDHGRCRSARGLEIHHIVHRADGGTHDASNLVLCCGSCHAAHHDGVLMISGTADHLEVRRRGEPGALGRRHDGEGNSARITGTGADVSGAAEARAHVGAPSVARDISIASAQPVRGDANGRSHRGAERNAGSSPGNERPAGTQARCSELGAHVGAPTTAPLRLAVLRAQAKEALVGLGWRSAIAIAAVTAAIEAAGATLALEQLIFDALRRCPAPSARA